MKKLLGVLLASLLPALVAQAQDVPQPPKVTAGFSFSGGYDFTFWGNTEFSNIPRDLRTVIYAPGSEPITFDAGHFKQKRNMAPLKAGLVLSFKNRVELEGGLAAQAMNLGYTKQIVSGSYTEGHTVTYFDILGPSGYLNGYYRTSVRIKGSTWIRAEAQIPIRSTDMVWKQGYSQWGDDETLSSQKIGTTTLSFIGLAGVSFCACDLGDGGGAFRFNLMAGMARSRTTINPQFSEIHYGGRDKSPILEISLDVRYDFHKKKQAK